MGGPGEELDAGHFEGQSSFPHLWSAADLHAAVGVFGYAPEDKIERRSQVSGQRACVCGARAVTQHTSFSQCGGAARTRAAFASAVGHFGIL
jgi:hypothetical protein